MSDSTNFIDESIPNELLYFINTEKFDDDKELYRITRLLYELYAEDYNKFPNSNTMESLDMKYNEDKGRFYRKYYKFAVKCKELMQMLNISGYGRNDLMKIKTKELCSIVDYNFPYGWKYNA